MSTFGDTCLKACLSARYAHQLSYSPVHAQCSAICKMRHIIYSAMRTPQGLLTCAATCQLYFDAQITCRKHGCSGSSMLQIKNMTSLLLCRQVLFAAVMQYCQCQLAPCTGGRDGRIPIQSSQRQCSRHALCQVREHRGCSTGHQNFHLFLPRTSRLGQA